MLEQLKDRSFRVYYLAEWTDPISVTVEKSMSIQQLLERTFEGSEYNFFAMDSLSLVLVKDPTRAIAREKLVEEALDRNQKVETYQFGSQGNLDVKQVTLSGTVVDLKTEDPIPYVSIQPEMTPKPSTQMKMANSVLLWRLVPMYLPSGF